MKYHIEQNSVQETVVGEEAVKRAIDDTGYTFISFSSEPYKKHGLFGR